MLTPREIRRAIESLPLGDREEILDWLGERSYFETPQNFVREPVAVYRVPELEALGAPVRETLTVEEYFELEERSALRHEYINGALYAMTGVSRVHNLISLGLAAVLRQHLREGPCYVFSTDLKLDLKLGEDRIFYYPDVMVACDRQGWGSHFIHNPRLVIEVLSPSTQSTDLREKALSYKRLPSVEEYVIAAQKECRVTVYRRAERWEPHTYAGYEALLELRSVGLKLPLDEIYRKALSEA
jgi:Uma2 family endonuclease